MNKGQRVDVRLVCDLSILGQFLVLTAQWAIDTGRCSGAVVLVQTRFACVEFGLLQRVVLTAAIATQEGWSTELAL